MLYNNKKIGEGVMSYFSESFNRKENLIPRTFDIDDDLYEKLEYLSKNIYDASINKLVNVAIEKLYESENIKVYLRNDILQTARGFLLRESVLEKLYQQKKKYKIPTYTIVNIAIRNALIDENIIEDK